MHIGNNMNSLDKYVKNCCTRVVSFSLCSFLYLTLISWKRTRIRQFRNNIYVCNAMLDYYVAFAFIVVKYSVARATVGCYVLHLTCFVLLNLNNSISVSFFHAVLQEWNFHHQASDVTSVTRGSIKRAHQ